MVRVARGTAWCGKRVRWLGQGKLAAAWRPNVARAHRCQPTRLRADTLEKAVGALLCHESRSDKSIFTVLKGAVC